MCAPYRRDFPFIITACLELREMRSQQSFSRFLGRVQPHFPPNYSIVGH
jgi:hypothetical protein